MVENTVFAIRDRKWRNLKANLEPFLARILTIITQCTSKRRLFFLDGARYAWSWYTIGGGTSTSGELFVELGVVGEAPGRFSGVVMWGPDNEPKSGE